MKSSLSRRSMLKLGAAGIAFSALGSRASFAQQGAITVSWFGGNARADLYNRLVDMFEESRGITVGREYAPYNDYFLKLGTQAVGGQMPDVVNVTHRELRGFSDRGWMLPLDDFIANGTIDLSKFPASVAESGKVNGTTYTISTGNSGPVIFYNEALFEEAGVEPFPEQSTWADYEAKVLEFNGKLPAGYYGGSDRSKDANMFEVFLRHLDASMFDANGHIAFQREHLAEWYSLWQRLRQAGGIPDAPTSAQDDGNPEPQRLFSTGRTAIFATNANQLHIWQGYQQAHRGDPINIQYLPHAAEEGKSVIVGAYFGIAANSRDPQLAAEFINWFVNDEEMAKVYLNEHGRLGNSDLQALVEPMLPGPSQRVSEFLDEMVPIAVTFPNYPENGADITSLFNSKSDAVAFEMSTPEQAADEFFSEVAAVAQIAS
jgi:multiple sugar transport system substrate-binding protein